MPSLKEYSYKAPFVYFGGKRTIADMVWSRLGDVPNYCEPFAGSLAVLLKRPHAPQIETVNDLDCFLANAWRSMSWHPDETAAYACWPVSEIDMQARHRYLVCGPESADFCEAMRADPEYCNTKFAGWWLYGINIWIGSGWCAGAGTERQRPHAGSAGQGLNRQLPHAGDAGRGLNRQLPHAGSAGRGLNRQLPHAGDAGRGIMAEHVADVTQYFRVLSERLARVRICCGDWSRILGPSVTTLHGLTGVFLDPPYSAEAGRDNNLYAEESGTVAHDVRAWALEHGDDPLFRIALCGYEGEHAMPDSWECLAWKARGGMGNQNKVANNNKHRERIWFSPHCLHMKGLFDV